MAARRQQIMRQLLGGKSNHVDRRTIETGHSGHQGTTAPRAVAANPQKRGRTDDSRQTPHSVENAPRLCATGYASALEITGKARGTHSTRFATHLKSTAERWPIAVALAILLSANAPARAQLDFATQNDT